MANQSTTFPKGWKITTLREVADIFDSKRIPLSSSERSKRKGPYPYYGASDIVDWIDDYIFDGEYLLISEDGENLNTRNTSIAFIAKGKFWVNNHAHVLKGKESHLNKYLSWYFSILDINPYISGAVQPKLSKTNLESIPILISQNQEEHRAIAAVLSSLDDKIELLREQNKTLEATAQAIFKEWFVNFNFPGATGKMIDSELGEIPEGWKVGTVNDVIERFSITYRCVQDDLSPQGKTPIFDQGTSGLYGHTERDADFQASTENPVILFTNHTCNMWFVNYSFCAIQNVIPFRGNADYSTFFVFYMTLGKVKFIEYKGHWPDFEQKKHIIPKPEIANQYAEFVKPLQYKIWNNNSQVETLSKLRDTLLPRLMKGEVRVAGFND